MASITHSFAFYGVFGRKRQNYMARPVWRLKSNIIDSLKY
jgi:hypothetical protein